MANILSTILVTGGVSVIAVALGYFIWIKTRPKKQSWKARVWRVAEGIRPMSKDKDGKSISDVSLSDLRPYAMDVLVREDIDKGITTYNLKSINRTTPAVTSDVEENWGQGEKIVNVLYDNEACTLMKIGYDRKIGEAVWTPVPYDRINSLKNDIAIRKERIQQKKDILQALLPYVAIVIALMAIIGITWMTTDSAVKQSQEASKQSEMQIQAQKDLAQMQTDAILALSNQGKSAQQINQNLNKGEVPKIEP